MTKSSSARKARRSPQLLLQMRDKMVTSLHKHFGPEMIQRLDQTTGWELADNKNLKLLGTDAFTDKIMAVNIQLLPKITGIRALYEDIAVNPLLDQETKDLFSDRLQGMVDNLKNHSAFEVLLEMAIGGNPFPINIDKMINLLEKIAFNMHSDKEEEDDHVSDK